MDAAALRRQLQRSRAKFSRCAVEARKRLPLLNTKVVLTWFIELNGSVTRARIQSATDSDAALNACLTRVIGGLSFTPPPAGGKAVAVTVPIQFR